MIELKSKYGEWALITGASSGIGKEFAARFASLGMNLIIVARRKNRLDELAESLKQKYGSEIISIQLDLSEENFINKLNEEIGDREIGMVVNNAGFGSRGEFINAEPEHEIKMVKTNCVAPVILTHHFISPMIKRRKGAVIFLGSITAFQPTPLMATYSATKAFNLFMGEALWWELKKYNIDVLALNPGGTDTEFQRIAKAGKGPLPRTVEEVVNTALESLGKKPSVVDGSLNKIMSFLVRFISRRAVVASAGKIATKLYNAE